MGLLLRLALVWAVGMHGPVDDEWAYRAAERTAELLTVWTPEPLECRAPGYPLFLHGLFVLGVSEPGMLVLQALLGTATLALVMTLARQWFGPAVAVVAGAILALHPTLLMYTVLFMSETLFLFYLLGFFVLLTWPGASRHTTAAAGVLLGLTISTRSTLLPFVGMLLVWMLLSSRWPRAERPARMIALVASMLLTIAPWTVRNAIVYHELIPLDCLSMQSLWQGNTATGWNVDIAKRYHQHSASPRERERFAFHEASAFLREQSADYPFRKLGLTVKTMLGQQDYVSAAFYPQQRFGPLSPSTSSKLIRFERYHYVVLTALGLVGFVMAAAGAPRTLVGLFAASLVVSHWVTFFFPRHRVPAIPFVTIFAAVALCRPREVWQPTRARALAAIIVVALFAVAVWRS